MGSDILMMSASLLWLLVCLDQVLDLVLSCVQELFSLKGCSNLCHGLLLVSDLLKSVYACASACASLSSIEERSHRCKTNQHILDILVVSLLDTDLVPESKLLLEQLVFILVVLPFLVPVGTHAAPLAIAFLPFLVLSNSKGVTNHAHSILPQLLHLLKLSLFTSYKALLVSLCHVLLTRYALVKLIPLITHPVLA
jgi:hypothetical protein